MTVVQFALALRAGSAPRVATVTKPKTLRGCSRDISIHGGELVEVAFEPGVRAQDEHARIAFAEIGECVGRTRRRKEEGTRAAGDDFVTDLHFQLAFQDVKAFGMDGMTWSG